MRSKETNAAYGEGCGAEVLRFFLLRSQYRSPITFSSVLIEEAHKALVRLYTAQGALLLTELRSIGMNPSRHASRPQWTTISIRPWPYPCSLSLRLKSTARGRPELVRQLLGLGRILNILGMDPEKFLQGGAGSL